MSDALTREVWEQFSDVLQDALDHGGNTHNLQDVALAILNEDAQLWVGREAILVTQIIDHPQVRMITSWLGGGDLDELVNELRPRAEEFGRANGCTRSALLSRDGWIRALRDEGYKPVARYLMKELAP